MKKVNHYKWLDKHFQPFLNNLTSAGLMKSPGNCVGMITAHGDKCYGYKSQWEKAGIEFPHGVALYLLTYLNPMANDVRETKNGWVDPCKWVIDNKDWLIPFLPPIDKNDPDVLSEY